jgi:hypothetical protein
MYENNTNGEANKILTIPFEKCIPTTTISNNRAKARKTLWQTENSLVKERAMRKMGDAIEKSRS